MKKLKLTIATILAIAAALLAVDLIVRFPTISVIVLIGIVLINIGKFAIEKVILPIFYGEL